MGELNSMVGFIEPVVDIETKPKKCIDAPESGEYDAVIIGGGPAGITAGVYLVRKQIKTLLITPDLGGQVLWTSRVENYPGYNVISGFELATHFREQLEQQPIHIKYNDRVVAIRLSENGGTVETESGTEYSFKSLIAASGKRSRPLDVPGEKKFAGRGVTYCATCDGPLYSGQTVVVIGGGNSAFTAANDLLAIGCTVHLVNNTPSLIAESVLIDKARSSGSLTVYLNHEAAEIHGDGVVTGITLRNLDSGERFHIEAAGVFVEIGLVPNSSFAEGILDLNDWDEIMVNCRCETKIPRFFAAGDVTNVPEKQIIVAAGEGAKAALGVSEYLLHWKR